LAKTGLEKIAFLWEDGWRRRKYKIKIGKPRSEFWTNFVYFVPPSAKQSKIYCGVKVEVIYN